MKQVAGDAGIVSTFINSRIDAAFLDAHPDVRLVATRSTTFDHIDIEECKRRGVAVCTRDPARTRRAPPLPA